MRSFTLRTIMPWLALPALALLSGCGGGNSASPSTSFTTSTIFPFMRAVQDGTNNVRITVQLRDGVQANARYLFLANGEKLYTSLNASPTQLLSPGTGNVFGNTLASSQNLKVAASRDLDQDFLLFHTVSYGNPEYFSDHQPAAGSTSVRAYVDFQRANQAFAGESFVDLPPAFTISAPAVSASVSRAAPLTLTWSNVDATSKMLLDVGALCDDNTQYSLTLDLGTDTGSATLNSSSYFPATGTAPTATCQVAFKLLRVRTAGVSPSFALGAFEGAQQRAVLFTITP